MSRRITAVTAAALTLVLATAVASGGSRSPGKQPPKNQTPPSISGSAQVPNTLTANTGTWQGKALRYAYQWLRCDSTGAGCSAIGGATSSTKALSTADVGRTLRVIVTASNRNGSAAATSAQTAVVVSAASPPPPPPPTTALPPSNTSLPTISGTAQQGQTMTSGTGSWSGTTPMTYSYQWQRCDSGGGSCAPVAGATSSTDLLGSADVGSTMRVSVTASNSVGSATASSAATAVVTATTAVTAPAAKGIYVQRLGSSYPSLSHLSSFDQLTVAPNTSYIASALTLRAPGEEILPYISYVTIRTSNWPAQTDYQTALNNGWLLKDGSGNYLTNCHYSGYIADVGSQSYQDHQINAIASFLQTTGADGVYWDDVLGDIAGLTCGKYPAKYPDKASWYSAQVAGIKRVGGALKAKGYYILANAYNSGDNTGGNTAQFWRDMAPGLNGVQSEYWIQEQHPASGLPYTMMRQVGSAWYQHWDTWEQMPAMAQNAGLDFHGLLHADKGSDYQIAISARATFMLEWDCSRGGGIAFDPSDGSDPYENGAWTTQIGCPTGAKYQVAPNVWRRDYARGYVIVNPTASAVTVGGRTIPAGIGQIIAN
jgi:Hypothetical glycosyl hydrolase family 15